MITETEGVWAIIDYNYDDYIDRVYPSEIEALRESNRQGYGKVKFLPWGMNLAEANKTENEGEK